MTYFNFDKLEDLKDGDILFFDELLNGNTIVLNACLTILEQRRFISGKPLPDIMIVAAANPQGMVPLTPQIKERFVWYDVEFDPIMWKKYMKGKYSMSAIMAGKLCTLIKNEDFKSNNFFSPRSVDKAVNMIIYDVPTPYLNTIGTIVNTPVENKLKKPVDLGNGRILEPNEMIPWSELIRLKRLTPVKKKVKSKKSTKRKVIKKKKDETIIK